MVNWDEGDSAIYRALAEVAVPCRVEQIATALSLIPFGRDESFRIVDAGCGEGIFTYAALTAFQHATAIALDGSASMREHAETLLTKFGRRADVREFGPRVRRLAGSIGRSGLLGVIVGGASSVAGRQARAV